MKKGILRGLVLCLMLALLAGAAVAQSAENHGISRIEPVKASDDAQSKVYFVDWIYGPSNLECSVSGTKVTLSWDPDASDFQDGYAIFLSKLYSSVPSSTPLGWYSVINGGDYSGYYLVPQKLLKKTEETSVTLTMSNPGTYWVDVYSYCNSPSTYLSAGWNCCFTIQSTTLGKPTGLKAVQTASKTVKLTWKAGTNAKNYLVYRKTGSGSWKKIATTTSLSWTDKKAANGKAFQYKVYAKNGSKKAASSAVKAYPMAKPGSVRAKFSSGKVTVSWKKVTGAKKYAVYQQAPGSSGFSKAKTVTTNKAVISVSTNGTYKYYVVPLRGSFEGLKSSTVSAKVTGGSDDAGNDGSVTYRAVLIGQSYENCNPAVVNPLPATKADVVAMKKMLENLSSTKYTYVKSVYDATEAQILSSINAVFSQADDDDVTIFFYSGHGTDNGGGAYQGALIGTDVGSSDAGYLTTYELRDALDRYKGTKIVLLNSCHSGAMIGKGEDTAASRAAAVKRFNSSVIRAFSSDEQSRLGELAADGYYVMTASKASQPSTGITTTLYTGQVIQWGAFTRALCEGCGWDMYDGYRVGLKADSNGDSGVSFHEAFLYVRTTVEKYKAELNPYFSGEGIVQDVQVWPTNCGKIFFAR